MPKDSFYRFRNMPNVEMGDAAKREEVRGAVEPPRRREGGETWENKEDDGSTGGSLTSRMEAEPKYEG